MEFSEEYFGKNCRGMHAKVLRELKIHEAENLARAEKREIELLEKTLLFEKIWAKIIKIKQHFQKTR